MNINLLDVFSFRNVINTLFRNFIHINSRIKDSKIRIDGNDNTINIMHGNNIKKLKIGIIGNNNLIYLDQDSKLRNLHILIQGNNHKIHIGSNTEILGATLISCGDNNQIVIGNHCLIAGGTEMRNCDGHHIFQEQQIINQPKKIKIDNHVWIGADVTILKGVHIKENSVIGIKSLVTHKYRFEENSIIAGIPAKIIKKNISWKK